MTDIGELVYRIKADVSELEREFGKAGIIVAQGGRTMQGALAGVAAQARSLLPILSVSAFVAFGKSAIDAAGRMTDLADQVGFSAGTLSALETGLVQTGATLDQFAASVNLMNANIGQAASGNQEMIKNFEALGISVSKLKALSPEDQFYSIAQALARVESQSKQTDLGRSIFGRGFAALLPIIKESNGNLADFVKQMQDMGKAMNDDQLKQLDELGDSITRVGLAIRNDLLIYLDKAIEGFLKLFDLGRDLNSSQLQGEIGRLRAQLNVPEQNRARDRMGNVINSDAALQKQIARLEGQMAVQKGVENAKGEEKPAKGASGSNSDVLKGTGSDQIKKAKDALADYNAELQRQHEYSMMAPRDAAAMKVYYDTLDLAQKAGIKNAEDLATANAEIAKSNYDLNAATEESIRSSQELKDKFSDSLSSIALDFDNAADAGMNFLKVLAQMAFERKIAGPLADSLLGTSTGGKGVLDDLFGGFFADGGSPPVGVPSIVGERGPEIFVPRTAGTVIPNHAMGGKTVIVQQTFNMQPGLAETVGAAIRQAAPQIAAAAQAGVLHDMQMGGTASRIIGNRA